LCHGIVAEIYVNIPENIALENIRSIVHVISSSPLLSQYQIKSIPAIAKHFLIPIHKIANLFLPKSHISSLEKKNFLPLKKMELSNLP
jgi:primosomal protein N'